MNTRPLAAVVAGLHRSASFKARDSHRRPLETLEFFGLRADMTVAEIWPTTGYWTEILGPFLRHAGHLYAVNFPSDHKDHLCRAQSQLITDKIRNSPDLYGSTTLTVLARGQYDIAPAASCDLILTVLNLHNWLWFPEYFNATLSAFRRVLKPGGVLGVVEHRGRPDITQPENNRTGYVNEDFAISEIERHGFRLTASSEIGANPRDTKDYPKGVWTLPPSLALGDVDRAQYLAVGESDRMTLKFTAPS